MPEISLCVRPSDCDLFGHANNTAYVSYVEQALLSALLSCDAEGQGALSAGWRWRPKTFTLGYRQVAHPGDRLWAALWLADADPMAPTIGCEITRHGGEGDIATICRTRSVWNRLAPQGDEPAPIPTKVLEELQDNAGTLPRPFDSPDQNAVSHVYTWQHTVTMAETGPQRCAHPQAIYEWIQEAIFCASAEAGWPLTRWIASDVVVLQHRHDTEFIAYPRMGDRVRVSSRILETRRIRGTWHVEVHRMPEEELLVREYSTGVFVNLAGRPTTPPPEMVREIERGRPLG